MAAVGAREAAAGWLRWVLGDEKRSISFVGMRQSFWRVSRGGAVLEWWGDGEGELLGARAGGGSVLEFLSEELANECAE